LYSGARISTGCKLKVSDFRYEEHNPTIRITEKGDKHRTVGIHIDAADAIREYIKKAGLTSGPLFRPRAGNKGEKLSPRPFKRHGMLKLIEGYLLRLPGGKKAVKDTDDSERRVCAYTAHSLRATTATLLLDAGVDIVKVQELLGHKHVTTTQIYDKRRRTTKESASHDVPI
jgi:site-specific recombinase XerD